MGSAIAIVDGGRAEAEIERLNIWIRNRAVRTALGRSAKVVIRAAKAKCHRSRVTGTRELWSAQTAADRQGVKDLVDTIGWVFRDYGERQVAVVGPMYPAGALGHLVEFQRRQILWGIDSGATIEGGPFLRPAADETKAEQQSEFVAGLQQT